MRCRRKRKRNSWNDGLYYNAVPHGLKACVNRRRIHRNQHQHLSPAQGGKSVFLLEESPEALVQAALEGRLGWCMPSHEGDSRKGSDPFRLWPRDRHRRASQVSRQLSSKRALHRQAGLVKGYFSQALISKNLFFADFGGGKNM